MRLPTYPAALSLVVALAAPAPALDAPLVPHGPLLTVAPVEGDVAAPEVLMDGEGRFLVVRYVGAPHAGPVVLHRFAADGAPIGGAVEMAAGSVGATRALGMNVAGRWAAVWGSVEGAVLVRVFDFDGNPRGETARLDLGTVDAGEELIRSTTPAAVALAADGSGLAVWRQLFTSPEVEDFGGFERLVGRRFDATGAPFGPELRFDAYFHVYALDVAATPEGGWAVVGQRVDPDQTLSESRLHLVAPDGSPIPVSGDLQIRHPGEEFPELAVRPDGSVLYTFSDFGGHGFDGRDGSCTGVFARFVAADGHTLHPEVQVNPVAIGCQGDPRPAALDGGWVVAWLEATSVDFVEESDDSRSGIYLSTFAADGSSLGGPIRLLPQDGGHSLAAAGDRAVLVSLTPGRVVAQRLAPAGEAVCAPPATHLCLRGERFRVDADWRDPYSAPEPFARRTGLATARPVTGDTGAFWFFRDANLELLTKVLDGRPANGHHWVFYGALTTVEYWLSVTDLATGAQARYYNPPLVQASRGDTTAFPGDAAPATAVPPPLAAPAAGEPPAPPLCGLDPTRLCLGDRFVARVSWRDPRSGASGVGIARPLTADSGAFSFFRPGNLELLTKVLDGRPVNGHHWVFYGSLTDVAFSLEVTDLATDRTVRYDNPPYTLQSGRDTTAFPDG